LLADCIPRIEAYRKSKLKASPASSPQKPAEKPESSSPTISDISTMQSDYGTMIINASPPAEKMSKRGNPLKATLDTLERLHSQCQAVLNQSAEDMTYLSSGKLSQSDVLGSDSEGTGLENEEMKQDLMRQSIAQEFIEAGTDPLSSKAEFSKSCAVSDSVAVSVDPTKSEALLDSSISDLKRLPAPTPLVPAQWMPDSASDVCLVCKTYFTFFRRKHHCRNWYLCLSPETDILVESWCALNVLRREGLLRYSTLPYLSGCVFGVHPNYPGKVNATCSFQIRCEDAEGMDVSGIRSAHR